MWPPAAGNSEDEETNLRESPRSISKITPNQVAMKTGIFAHPNLDTTATQSLSSTKREQLCV